MPAFCIPSVVGIPGRESTFLDWWTPSTVPMVNFPEDPNWLGAFSIGDGNGTSNQVLFRALSGVVTAPGVADAHFLYLSWIVYVQPTLARINFDGLNLLVGDGANYVALKMRFAQDTAVNDSASAYALTSNNYNGTTLSGAHPTTAPWATDTGRLWISYPSPVSNVSPTPTIPWAFQVRVPVGVNLAPAAGGFPNVTLPLASSFKLWYQLNLTITGAGGTKIIVPYPMPGTSFSSSDINYIPSGLVPKDFALPGAAGGCFTGVTLSRSNIAVEDVTTGAVRNTIQLDLTSPTPDVSLPQHQNVFFARPDVSSLSAAQISHLRADFRLANWGTQFTVATPNSWKIIPGGQGVTYQGASAPFPAEFRTTWPKPPLDTFTTDFINGVKLFNSSGGMSGQSNHQCMLVEMDSSGDPTIVFTKRSEFNNLWAVNASLFQDVADVSTVGNPPIGLGPREIYLYLQTLGMPEKVSGDYTQRMSRWFKEGRLSATYDGPIDRQGGMTNLFDYAPTYQVHGYYDTGQTMEYADGTRLKIYRPQTSFGYVVSHEGDLVGWDTRLYGAEKVSPSLYHLFVPNESAVRLRVAIQARETPDEKPLPDDGQGGQGGCCMALAAWLYQRGPVGRVLGLLVSLICRLLGRQ